MAKYEPQFVWQKDGPLIAKLHEVTEFSVAGIFCVVFLIVSATVTFIALLASSNVIQQAAAGAAGMAWIITFGIGAIICRRRTYYVHRHVEAEAESKG